MTSERVERRLAAILACDVAGYSRLMGANEVGTLEALKAHRREVVDPAIAERKGRIVKTTGDGMLVEFASAVDAVTCAIAIQEELAERRASGAEPRITFRIGVNIGDIIIDGDISSVMASTLPRVSKTRASRAGFTFPAMFSSRSEARPNSRSMILVRRR
jgi:class 3 adenylate cyclase